MSGEGQECYDGVLKLVFQQSNVWNFCICKLEKESKVNIKKNVIQRAKLR